MVRTKTGMHGSRPAQTQYDFYCDPVDNIGNLSSELDRTAEQIVTTCGIGHTLNIGSGEGLLVAALLNRGVDAKGFEISEAQIAHCNERMPGRFTHGSVLDLPFEDASFHTVAPTNCLERLALEDVPKALREIYRVSSRYVFLQITTLPNLEGNHRSAAQGRAWWESKCFEAGFRKHAAYYELNDYEALNADGRQILIPLEKITDTALKKYPLTALAEERSLHMDMPRETGRRSDGHIFHYQFASKYIKPGDVVLDAACGLGYGSHVLLSNSLAKKVIGVDLSAFAIDYASAMYGSDEIVFFQGCAENLEFLDDCSVDFISSFETLEHVNDPKDLLSEFYRILKPTGRLIVSVPNLWVDETGKDPNPWHFHVYDWATLNEQLSRHFSIEERFDQIAGGGFKLPHSPRSFKPLINEESCNGKESESEWCIAVAFKQSKESSPRFEETVNPYSKPPINLLDFSSNYENPWLIREICEARFRIKNTDILISRCKHLIEKSDKKSADYGAALCVFGYRVLEEKSLAAADIFEFERNSTDYINLESKNPHVLRWQTSLSYLVGLLFLKIGNREKQQAWFERCANSKYDEFSPVLATKIVSAARHIGFLFLSNENEAGAIPYFQRAMLVALDALKNPTEEWIGKIDWPLTCTYYDAMQLLDDGLHSAVVMSELLSGRGSRLNFYRFLFHGGYKDSGVKQIGYTIETAKNSLLKLQRLSAERQELYVTAEQRLSNLQRLGAERQELYETAEQRLSDLQRLGAERQELYEIAEQRLSDLQRLGAERKELYETAEQRLSDLQRLSAEREELYETAEQRLYELNSAINRLNKFESMELIPFLGRYLRKKYREMAKALSSNNKKN